MSTSPSTPPAMEEPDPVETMKRMERRVSVQNVDPNGLFAGSAASRGPNRFQSTSDDESEVGSPSQDLTTPVNRRLSRARLMQHADEPAVKAFLNAEEGQQKHRSSLAAQARAIAESAVKVEKGVSVAEFQTRGGYRPNMAGLTAGNNGAAAMAGGPPRARRGTVRGLFVGPRLKNETDPDARVEECMNVLLEGNPLFHDEVSMLSVMSTFSHPSECLERIAGTIQKLLTEMYDNTAALTSALQEQGAMGLHNVAESMRKIFASLALLSGDVHENSIKMRSELGEAEATLQQVQQHHAKAVRIGQEMVNENEMLRQRLFASKASAAADNMGRGVLDKDALEAKPTMRHLVMIQTENTHAMRLKRPHVIGAALLVVQNIVESVAARFHGTRINFNGSTETREHFDKATNRNFAAESYALSFTTAFDAVRFASEVQIALVESAEWHLALMALEEFAVKRRTIAETEETIYCGIRARIGVHSAVPYVTRPLADMEHDTAVSQTPFYGGVAMDKTMLLLQRCRGGETLLTAEGAAAYHNEHFKDGSNTVKLVEHQLTSQQPGFAKGECVFSAIPMRLEGRERPEFDPTPVKDAVFPQAGFWRKLDQTESLQLHDFEDESEALKQKVALLPHQFRAQIDHLQDELKRHKEQIRFLKTNTQRLSQDLIKAQEAAAEADKARGQAIVSKIEGEKYLVTMMDKMASLEQSSMTWADMHAHSTRSRENMSDEMQQREMAIAQLRTQVRFHGEPNSIGLQTDPTLFDDDSVMANDSSSPRSMLTSPAMRRMMNGGGPHSKCIGCDDTMESMAKLALFMDDTTALYGKALTGDVAPAELTKKFSSLTSTVMESAEATYEKLITKPADLGKPLGALTPIVANFAKVTQTVCRFALTKMVNSKRRASVAEFGDELEYLENEKTSLEKKVEEAEAVKAAALSAQDAEMRMLKERTAGRLGEVQAERRKAEEEKAALQAQLDEAIKAKTKALAAQHRAEKMSGKLKASGSGSTPIDSPPMQPQPDGPLDDEVKNQRASQQWDEALAAMNAARSNSEDPEVGSNSGAAVMAAAAEMQTQLRQRTAALKLMEQVARENQHKAEDKQAALEKLEAEREQLDQIAENKVEARLRLEFEQTKQQWVKDQHDAFIEKQKEQVQKMLKAERNRGFFEGRQRAQDSFGDEMRRRREADMREAAERAAREEYERERTIQAEVYRRVEEELRDRKAMDRVNEVQEEMTEDDSDIGSVTAMEFSPREVAPLSSVQGSVKVGATEEPVAFAPRKSIKSEGQGTPRTSRRRQSERRKSKVQTFAVAVQVTEPKPQLQNSVTQTGAITQSVAQRLTQQASLGIKAMDGEEDEPATGFACQATPPDSPLGVVDPGLVLPEHPCDAEEYSDDGFVYDEHSERHSAQQDLQSVRSFTTGLRTPEATSPLRAAPRSPQGFNIPLQSSLIESAPPSVTVTPRPSGRRPKALKAKGQPEMPAAQLGKLRIEALAAAQAASEVKRETQAAAFSAADVLRVLNECPAIASASDVGNSVVVAQLSPAPADLPPGPGAVPTLDEGDEAADRLMAALTAALSNDLDSDKEEAKEMTPQEAAEKLQRAFRGAAADRLKKRQLKAQQEARQQQQQQQAVTVTAPSLSATLKSTDMAMPPTPYTKPDIQRTDSRASLHSATSTSSKTVGAKGRKASASKPSSSTAGSKPASRAGSRPTSTVVSRRGSMHGGAQEPPVASAAAAPAPSSVPSRTQSRRGSASLGATRREVTLIAEDQAPEETIVKSPTAHVAADMSREDLLAALQHVPGIFIRRIAGDDSNGNEEMFSIAVGQDAGHDAAQTTADVLPIVSSGDMVKTPSIASPAFAPLQTSGPAMSPRAVAALSPRGPTGAPAQSLVSLVALDSNDAGFYTRAAVTGTAYENAPVYIPPAHSATAGWLAVLSRTAGVEDASVVAPGLVLARLDPSGQMDLAAAAPVPASLRTGAVIPLPPAYAAPLQSPTLSQSPTMSLQSPEAVPLMRRALSSTPKDTAGFERPTVSRSKSVAIPLGGRGRDSPMLNSSGRRATSTTVKHRATSSFEKAERANSLDLNATQRSAKSDKDKDEPSAATVMMTALSTTSIGSNPRALPTPPAPALLTPRVSQRICSSKELLRELEYGSLAPKSQGRSTTGVPQGSGTAFRGGGSLKTTSRSRKTSTKSTTSSGGGGAGLPGSPVPLSQLVTMMRAADGMSVIRPGLDAILVSVGTEDPFKIPPPVVRDHATDAPPPPRPTVERVVVEKIVEKVVERVVEKQVPADGAQAETPDPPKLRELSKPKEEPPKPEEPMTFSPRKKSTAKVFGFGTTGAAKETEKQKEKVKDAPAPAKAVVTPTTGTQTDPKICGTIEAGTGRKYRGSIGFFSGPVRETEKSTLAASGHKMRDRPHLRRTSAVTADGSGAFSGDHVDSKENSGRQDTQPVADQASRLGSAASKSHPSESCVSAPLKTDGGATRRPSGVAALNVGSRDDSQSVDGVGSQGRTPPDEGIPVMDDDDFAFEGSMENPLAPEMLDACTDTVSRRPMSAVGSLMSGTLTSPKVRGTPVDSLDATARVALDARSAADPQRAGAVGSQRNIIPIVKLKSVACGTDEPTLMDDLAALTPDGGESVDLSPTEQRRTIEESIERIKRTLLRIQQDGFDGTAKTTAVSSGPPTPTGVLSAASSVSAPPKREAETGGARAFIQTAVASLRTIIELLGGDLTGTPFLSKKVSNVAAGAVGASRTFVMTTSTSPLPSAEFPPLSHSQAQGERRPSMEHGTQVLKEATWLCDGDSQAGIPPAVLHFWNSLIDGTASGSAALLAPGFEHSFLGESRNTAMGPLPASPLMNAHTTPVEPGQLNTVAPSSVIQVQPNRTGRPFGCQFPEVTLETLLPALRGVQHSSTVVPKDLVAVVENAADDDLLSIGLAGDVGMDRTPRTPGRPMSQQALRANSWAGAPARARTPAGKLLPQRALQSTLVAPDFLKKEETMPAIQQLPKRHYSPPRKSPAAAAAAAATAPASPYDGTYTALVMSRGGDYDDAIARYMADHGVSMQTVELSVQRPVPAPNVQQAQLQPLLEQARAYADSVMSTPRLGGADRKALTQSMTPSMAVDEGADSGSLVPLGRQSLKTNSFGGGASGSSLRAQPSSPIPGIGSGDLTTSLPQITPQLSVTAPAPAGPRHELSETVPPVRDSPRVPESAGENRPLVLPSAITPPRGGLKSPPPTSTDAALSPVPEDTKAAYRNVEDVRNTHSRAGSRSSKFETIRRRGNPMSVKITAKKK